MQQVEHSRGSGGADRKRVEAVVETLATLRSEGETLAEVAHDARNMVTALGLYCDLLEEPGVLAAPFLHYGSELRLVAAASHRLVEKLVALDSGAAGGFSQAALRIPAVPATEPAPGDSRDDTSLGQPGLGQPGLRQEGRGQGRLNLGKPDMGRPDIGGLEPRRPERARRWDAMPAEPIDDLARELEATRSLLAALAGPSITLTVATESGAKAVWLTGEDLTRVLVNLVKNAAEAMPAGGRIQLGLREVAANAGGAGNAARLRLTIEDDGPGIPQKALEKVFESGYTTHTKGSSKGANWPAAHRGLGLSITRSVIGAAGGQIHALDRSQLDRSQLGGSQLDRSQSARPQTGACFEIELPIRTR